ncbi:MAG: DUF362 domain-containing protein [Thermodesulfobacteriota bacterium]
MRVDIETCTSCGFCVRDCPVGAVRIKAKKALIDPVKCTDCRVCLRVCPEGAVLPEAEKPEGALECTACPIRCWVRESSLGACQRYRNVEGALIRIAPLQTYADVREEIGPEADKAIEKPLLTGIGAGTTYPDYKPAPHIVHGRQGDVDVVTVVSEAPLSYSSIMVKIDTDLQIGKEGASVLAGKRVVGMVETEQYGSKMLHIGGVNRLTAENGFLAARLIADIANRKRVKLRIEGGSRLEIQVGRPPLIDGREASKMRVGCGSATLGIFAPKLLAAADEAIVLDSHITGLLSEHMAGKYAGVRQSGISLRFRQSTPGRYFGDHGQGWGGTSIEDPAKVIKDVDMDLAWPGMTLLITETTGQKGAMFEVQEDGALRPVSLTDKAAEVLEEISETCEPSLVSAIYTGGAGGSARAGVTRHPIKLTRQVQAKKARLTIGGAPAFVLPGGGITFMVDVGRVKPGSFSWTPTPATICPVEYTMTVEDYREMGGHVQAMRPFETIDPKQK